MIPLRAIRPQHLRRSAWLLVFALAFNALAPSLAQAFASAQGQPGRLSGHLVTMCTSQGLQQVLIEAPNGGGIDPAALLAVKHCPFCLGADPLPPLPVVRTAPVVGASVAIIVTVDAPPPTTPTGFWPATAPRGPPAVV